MLTRQLSSLLRQCYPLTQFVQQIQLQCPVIRAVTHVTSENIDALNKELDDFFGAPVSTSEPLRTSGPSSSTSSSSSSTDPLSSPLHVDRTAPTGAPGSVIGRFSDHQWASHPSASALGQQSFIASTGQPVQGAAGGLVASSRGSAPAGAAQRPPSDSAADEEARLSRELVAATAHGYAGGAAGDGAVTIGIQPPSPASADPVSGLASLVARLEAVTAALKATLTADAVPGSSWPAWPNSSLQPTTPTSSNPAADSSTPGLSHVDPAGRASMVDVSAKAVTRRSATASCRVVLGPEVFPLVQHNQLKKGDVLRVAQLAGIMGAKHTSLLIPLCHNLNLSKVDVQLQLHQEAHAVDISATAVTVGQTGVEMEALTAASVAALTIYDMCKAVSKDIQITGVQLEAKQGGKSGSYVRPPPAA